MLDLKWVISDKVSWLSVCCLLKIANISSKEMLVKRHRSLLECQCS